MLDKAHLSGVKAATTVAWPHITFPIPGVAGAMATATLDNGYLPTRIVVTHGTNKTEFAYSNYEDWNNPLNKIEALYAGTISERRNGTLLRDLKTTQTETGNVYVAVPVPIGVRRAAAK
jgi:hypothetical protein